MTPRFAVTAIFALNGAAFASWYARLPAIQEDLGLSDGAIGLVLLGAPAGLLVAQPLTGAVLARRGSLPVLRLAPLALLAIALPAFATDPATLAVAVVLTGASNGCLDVAMNAQGISVERAGERRLFSSLHAAFSFGALGGAVLAGGAAGLGLEPLAHLSIVAVAAALCALALRPAFLADPPLVASQRFARPSRALLAVGAVAFCALLAEGAMFDWSAIFLGREAGASDAVAPLGLAAFSLAMGVGRLAGDGVAERFGVRATVTAGLLAGGAGLALAVSASAPATTLAGFIVMGLGLAPCFPLALRAAERAAGTSSGPAIAAVSTLGYCGLLLGPPLIGLLSQATGDLGIALGAAAALCLVATLPARRLERA